jgi:hypothetical protein
MAGTNLDKPGHDDALDPVFILSIVFVTLSPIGFVLAKSGK